MQAAAKPPAAAKSQSAVEVYEAAEAKRHELDSDNLGTISEELYVSFEAASGAPGARPSLALAARRSICGHVHLHQ